MIVHKGTEPPFSGKYNDYFEKGVYTCRRCGAGLFESESKFPSHCGWPSFDDQIPGAVTMQPDKDGVSTEIICTTCWGHLGHVFKGERLTAKDTRYCVNSVSMEFIPAQRLDKAVFAAGCFWGVEYHFKTAPGVISTTVGYTGGDVNNPTYAQVSTDRTGHAEAVEVVFDTNGTTFERLARLFFEIHDFTQVNRQGPDVGTRYRSAIFYRDPNQRDTVLGLIGQLRGKGLDVYTQVLPLGRFWPAETYHQDYYAKTGLRPYCHVRRRIWQDD